MIGPEENRSPRGEGGDTWYADHGFASVEGKRRVTDELAVGIAKPDKQGDGAIDLLAPDQRLVPSPNPELA